MNQYLTVENKNGTLEVNLSDDWVFANIPDLTEALDLIDADAANEVIFKCGGLREFDLSGAWLLYDKALDIEDEGLQTEQLSMNTFRGFSTVSPGISGATAWRISAETPSKPLNPWVIYRAPCWTVSGTLHAWLSAKPSVRFMLPVRRLSRLCRSSVS
jgi:hypothetical protein